ncbi:MAG: hypothetical protein J6N52_05495 [Clostridia bacterium]|nr:hypothetical protein [Clostridia bacterium]
MKKVSLIGLLVTAVLFVWSGSFTALAADTRLDARSFTSMPLESGHDDMDKLKDGSYEGAVVVSTVNTPINENSYIDIYFNGYIANVNALEIACNESLFDAQGVTGIAVLGYDDNTQRWNELPDEYTPEYIAEAGVKKAHVTLKSTIKASRIRVYIREANTKWSNFRLEELAAFGSLSGEDINSLTKKASVTASFDGVSRITDGKFASEAIVEGVKPTESEPAVITFDFGYYYSISDMEMVTLFARNAGIKSMDIEYKENNTWAKLGDTINFTRGEGKGSTNFEIDRIPVNITTTALRILIKDVYYDWSHFRLSDIFIYEKTPVLSGTRLDARSFTNMPLERGHDDMDKLKDGSYEGAVVVSTANTPINENSYIDIYFNGYIADVNSLEIACNEGLLNDQGVTAIGVLGYDEKAHKWFSTPAEEYGLSYAIQDGNARKAYVTLKTPVKASRIRVYIRDANTTWNNFRLEELAAFGSLTGEKIENIAGNAAVTSSFGGEDKITDSNFASETVVNGAKPTKENPAMVSFDFGNNYYRITDMEMITLFARNAGIKEMDIEYKVNNAWTKLGDTINFTRGEGKGSTNFEIDRLPVNAVTNGIRFIIKDTYYEWSHFRLSDIILYGESEMSASVSFYHNNTPAESLNEGEITAKIDISSLTDDVYCFLCYYDNTGRMVNVSGGYISKEDAAQGYEPSVYAQNGGAVKLLILNKTLQPVLISILK